MYSVHLCGESYKGHVQSYLDYFWDTTNYISYLLLQIYIRGNRLNMQQGEG